MRKVKYDHHHEVAYPRMPSIRPQGFERWPPDRKLEYLLQTSLSRIADYLEWDPNTIEPTKLMVQSQAVRIVAMLASKVVARNSENDVVQRLTRAMEEAKEARELGSVPSAT